MATAEAQSPRSGAPSQHPHLGFATTTAFLDWFATHGRDLPWRRTRDPWAILVSEAMLQQTQVARVIPKYHAFLTQFPDPQTCADARPGAIVEAWAGLGYNRRALQLHRCAVAIVNDHDGHVPATLAALLALPGVGPYTARAVLAFAFEQTVGVVDINVARILSRTSGQPLRQAQAQLLADAHVPDGQGWAWNQAMLDLGATICVARTPQCPKCPLKQSCAWARRAPFAVDPASQGVGAGSRQSRFEGSDRQGRGRLVAALRDGPVGNAPDALAAAMGWPDDPARAVRVAQSVLDDQLAVIDGPNLTLP